MPAENGQSHNISILWCFFTASTGQVLYFGFDRVSGSAVFDDSGSENNGELTSLATVTKTSGTCGNGLRLRGGETSSKFTTLETHKSITYPRKKGKSIILNLDEVYSHQKKTLLVFSLIFGSLFTF